MIRKTLAVMALLAVTYCFAQDARMDWRWGRPGVLVNTNMPSTVTINGVPWYTGTNGAFTVEGGIGGGTSTTPTNYVMAVEIAPNKYQLYLVTP